MPGKITVEKKLKRAGATPLFWLPAAQKVLGVAPALDAIAVGLFSTVKSRSKQSFMHALLKPACRKGETTLAILKSPPKPPKNETLQIRIEEHVRSRLGKYAEFIDSSESYVVSEALKLVFKKDPEFRSWLEHQNHNDDEPENDGGSLFEIAKKA
jgi:predicted transcriptional regulator